MSFSVQTSVSSKICREEIARDFAVSARVDSVLPGKFDTRRTDVYCIYSIRMNPRQKAASHTCSATE
jgi:hypothetical protein